MDFDVKRGDVYWISYAEGAVGSEPTAHRPYVIVSSNRGNETSPTVLGVNITTKPRWGILNPEVQTQGKSSWVNCNTVLCIDKSRLQKYMCSLTEEEMERVSRGICLAMSLYPNADEIEDLRKENEELREQLAEYENEDDEEYEEEEVETDTDIMVERDMYERLYEKALTELVNLKMDRDIVSKAAAPVVHKEKVTKPVEVSSPAEPEAPSAVELNTCTEAELRSIGCSPTMVHHILANRPYKSVDDLRRVPSITNVGYKIIKNKVTCIPVVKEKKSGKVNVNTATWQEISEISGLGAETSRQICQYRNKYGPFKKVEDLANVPRFGNGCFKRYGSKFEV